MKGFNGEDFNRISDADSSDNNKVYEKIDYVYRTPNVNFSLSQFIEFVAHCLPMFWYHPYAHKWLPISLAPPAYISTIWHLHSCGL